MKILMCALSVSSCMFAMQTNQIVKVDNTRSKVSVARNVSSKNVARHMKDPAVFVPHALGKVSLHHDGAQFHVKQGGKSHVVHSYMIDPALRNITTERLTAFGKVGYISVNRTNDGEFSLRANTRGLGGGPITGAIVYWGVKSLGWGAVGLTCSAGVAAVTAATVSTGGVATGAIAANAMAFGAASTVTGVAGTGLAAGGAAAITAMGPVAVSTAVSGTVGASVGAAGGIAAIGASIETAAMAASFGATICPWLP